MNLADQVAVVGSLVALLGVVFLAFAQRAAAGQRSHEL